MKYNIDYTEFWAVKHCNLNCKGCSSCSPIAEPWYLDVGTLKRDLQRLLELEISIHNISILGGEPLLHPRITELFDTVKSIYPDCNLGLLTNGLLLLEMKGEFWTSCQRNDVKLNITCFPVMNDRTRRRIAELVEHYGLRYHLTDKKRFNKILVRNNTASIEEITESCGCNRAYNLYDGYMSRCTVPMAVPILNHYFHADMIEDGKINIYDVRDGGEIVEYLSKPNRSCKNCSAFPIKTEWERAGDKPQLEDWLIT